MRFPSSIFAVIVFPIAFILSGCGEKPKPEAAPEETGQTEGKPAVVESSDDTGEPANADATVDLEARAKLMGFARFVPGDFQTFVSLRPQLIHGRLKDTRVFEFMTEEMEAAAEDGPLDFFEDCEEIFFTTGSTTAKQTDVLYQISAEFMKLTYLEMYEELAIASGLMLPADAKTGEFNNSFDALPEELRRNFTEHVDRLDAAQMPVMIMAARFRNKTEEIEETLAGMESTLLDGPDFPLELIELDRSPTEQLLAFELNFANTLDKEDFLDSVKEMGLTDAQFERLYEVLSSKKLVFGFGKKEDYLVFFACESADQLQFAKSLDESLVSATDCAYFEKFADKPMVYQQMASEEYASTYGDISQRTLENYIDPARDVLDRINLFEDKRDLMAMLEGIETIGKEIYKTKGGTMVGAGYIEDGFKLEVRGGLIPASLDVSVPSRFAALANDPSFTLVWNMNITQEGKTNLLEFEQLLGEFVLAMSDRYFALDLAEKEQVELYQFYTTALSGDLRKVWMAMKDEWAAGLGNEGVVVMDTIGAMPKFPVVPSEFTSDAKIPRMAVMYPVTDRERLQKSWESIEPSLRNVIEAISKRADAGFTLPDPSVTKTDDLRVYSYPVTGFTNDDFLPCLAVSDDYLVFSSSKLFAMELIERMKSGEVKESPGGQYIDLNLTTLREYGRHLVEVTRKHERILSEDDVMMEWFNGIGTLESVLDGMEFLDGIRYSNTQDSAGNLSTLLHLKFKDIPEPAYERLKTEGGPVEDAPQLIEPDIEFEIE